MKIDNQNEITVLPSEQHQEVTSSWEGKKVSKKPVESETTKKSITVFTKVKNFMKAAWRNKYKILLATLGVITLGAAVTGASVLIAKKVNRKALPQIKPNDEEGKTPKLTHPTLDRPVREGIRRPTQHKLHEKLVSGENKVDEEVIVAITQKDDQIVDSHTSPDPDDQLVKVEKDHVESSEDKEQGVPGKSQEHVIEKQPDQEVKEPVIMQIASDEDSVLEQFILETVIADSAKIQEHQSVSKPQQSPVRKPRTRKQIHEERKLKRKLSKYKRKMAGHPKKQIKYNHKIAKAVQKLSVLSR